MPQEIKNEKIGTTGKITRLFLENREISILTIVILAVWGTLSFFFMPKQYNPEIVAPAFLITTEFPGASVNEVSEFITKPLENKIAELPGIDEISSQSFPGGKSIVMVKFLVGSNLENAKITLNQKLGDNMGIKPVGAFNPIIRSIDPNDVPILDIGLTSESLSESSLRKLAFDVADRLKLAEGVSQFEIKGGRINHLQIRIDATKMKAHEISLESVIQIMEKNNGIFTVDQLKTDSLDPMVNITGNITDTSTLSNIIIQKNGDSIIRLSDIGSVSYDPGEIRHTVRISNKNETPGPIVHIALSKLKGANSTEVSQNILDILETLKQKTIPDDVSIILLNDEGETANDEITKLTHDLIKSILIVLILLAFFLGMRNALIAAISIPLVLLAVFGIGLLAGETVNRITLFALILSLGLLVDDAIVVVENIARYLRLYPNENKVTLIVRAVDEVGGALALSTFTMALAFLPMAFVTGMMGPYMGPIPFFVPVALFASLLFAITINPFLAMLLIPKKQSFQENQTPPSYESGFLFRLMKKVENSYGLFLATLLSEKPKRRSFSIWVGILLLLSTLLPMTPLVPFRMLPKADKDQFFVYLDLPAGTDVIKTDTVSATLERIILEDTEVMSVEGFIGTPPIIDFNGLFKGSSERALSNQATIKAHLRPHTERNISSEEIVSRLRSQLDIFTREYPDTTIRLIEDPPGPPVLSTFLLKIKGNDTATLEHISRDMEEKIRAISGIVDIETSLPEYGFNLTYQIDHEKAGLLGIMPQDAVRALQNSISGISIGRYHGKPENTNRMPEEEHIIIRFNEASRDSKQDLSLIQIMSRDGSLVPLSEILIETKYTTNQPIRSDEREATTYLSGEMENRSIIYAIVDLFPVLLSYTPNNESTLISWSLLGVEYEDQSKHERYRIEIDGEWKLTLEVFRDLGIAMGLAIFLIYFVLSAKTGSLFMPLLIMTSIPLALIGVLPGFAILHLIKGTYFNATSMIGVIALSGLAVKNVVIYLEYLEPLKKSGVSIEEALVLAGRIRFLPIVLTSLAAILGSFTIISDPVWEGLAWAIILGLTASTALTFIVFPLVYYAFEKKHWPKK